MKICGFHSFVGNKNSTILPASAAVILRYAIYGHRLFPPSLSNPNPFCARVHVTHHFFLVVGCEGGQGRHVHYALPLWLLRVQGVYEEVDAATGLSPLHPGRDKDEQGEERPCLGTQPSPSNALFRLKTPQFVFEFRAQLAVVPILELLVPHAPYPENDNLTPHTSEADRS